MKQLLILRHAKSSWKETNLNDFERPLNKRGKRDAPRMGELLADLNLTPDVIISSAARRALNTAEAVAESSGYESDILATRELYMAMPEDFVALLRAVSDTNKCVMVVGHNPGIEELVEDLSGSWERMPTAALAQIELSLDSWSSISSETAGKLRNLWYPKELS